MNSVVLVSLAFCLLVLPFSEAIKCYNCYTSSLLNKKSKGNDLPFPIPSQPCGNYDDSVLSTCGPAANVCHSIIVDIDADGIDSQTAAIKICGDSMTKQTCSLLGTKSASVKASCYTCESDKCNSATSTALSVTLIIGAAATFKLFY